MRRLRSGLSLKSSWNYKKKSLLFINIILIALALYASLARYGSSRSGTSLPVSERAQPLSESQLPQSLVEKIQGQIQRKMTLTEMLSAYGFPQGLSLQLLMASRPTYNLSKLVVGKRFEMEKLSDGTLKQFRYEVSLDRYLNVSLTEEGYKAELKPVNYETRTEFVSGTITSSLFHAISALDEGDQLALALAEIFSYDIDFNADLQEDDHFRVAVEKHFLDGKFVKYGKILAAEFVNKREVHWGFYFTDSTEQGGYFDAEGKSLKRELLRSPIKFCRVSSTFSRKRFHPILKKYQSHLGVDYAAPRGTPVVAAGNGRVQYAGWKGGFGRFLQLKHGSELTSMYGHLSRIAPGIRTGANVRQGQVIGYVGDTGLATGPHLDYRITHKGHFVNPLSVTFQRSAPLRIQQLTEFRAQSQKWRTQLAGISSPLVPFQTSATVRGRNPK
jgi:murein DD-endopeptidase MepM/ murein hydrolase activator NlpD